MENQVIDALADLRNPVNNAWQWKLRTKTLKLINNKKVKDSKY